MVVLVMMQASKKVPFDDPMVLNGVRALYVFSNVVILGIYLYVQMQINKKKGGNLRARTTGPLRCNALLTSSRHDHLTIR